MRRRRLVGLLFSPLRAGEVPSCLVGLALGIGCGSNSTPPPHGGSGDPSTAGSADTATSARSDEESRTGGPTGSPGTGGPTSEATAGTASGTAGTTTGALDCDAMLTDTWRDRLLDAKGDVDPKARAEIAKAYHSEAMLEYRLGPRRAPECAPMDVPLVPQPDPLGLWRGGTDADLAQRFCQPPEGLPKSDQEERALYDGGGGWMMSGQLLFAPDGAHDAYDPAFRYGSANVRTADGAQAMKLENGELETRALCMRLRAEWVADWWNRNNISTPTTPAVARAVSAFPDLPLPPVATARGGAQVSVTGFLAFQDGLLMAAGTGNDGYEGGFGGDPNETAYPFVRLAPGKVPTALAVTPTNEFVLVTVWDTESLRGQLAIVAVGAGAFPATVPHGWGVHNWPQVASLKVLGYVDLPFSSPSAVSVTHSKPANNLRGTSVVEDGALLGSQSQRDAYRAIPWQGYRGEDRHKLLAHSGHALVASRAENKVAFVDLQPLFAFYREMYLTTQARFDATRPDRQGPAADQWPYTFEHEPKQRPRVLGSLDIPQPTAVLTRLRPQSTNTRAPDNDLDASYRTALIASMDGTVRLYDLSDLADPEGPRLLPKAPPKTVQVGENPLQLANPIISDGAMDDLFVVSRGDASIHVFDYRLSPIGVLADRRLVDPVFVAISNDGAGWGGRGPGYALHARVLTVLDFTGQQLVDYGMAVGSRDDLTTLHPESWDFRGPTGELERFQCGYANPLPGRPFMLSFDEVI